MKTFKIGNVYCRKGFHYKVLDDRALDDTFTHYLLIASFCSDCGDLYQFDIPLGSFRATNQRRRCNDCKKRGVKAKPWRDSKRMLANITTDEARLKAALKS